MSYLISDLIIDLVWAASEILLGKKKGRDDEELKKPDPVEKNVASDPYRRPQL